MLARMSPPRTSTAGRDADTTSPGSNRAGARPGRGDHEHVAKFFRALGEPSRLALLLFCREQERTGTDCVNHVGLSQGRVSAHLSCLVDCGLLAVRREGRFAFYQVVDRRVVELVGLAEQMAADHAESIAACLRTDPVNPLNAVGA